MWPPHGGPQVLQRVDDRAPFCLFHPVCNRIPFPTHGFSQVPTLVDGQFPYPGPSPYHDIRLVTFSQNPRFPYPSPFLFLALFSLKYIGQPLPTVLSQPSPFSAALPKVLLDKIFFPYPLKFPPLRALHPITFVAPPLRRLGFPQPFLFFPNGSWAPGLPYFDSDRSQATPAMIFLLFLECEFIGSFSLECRVRWSPLSTVPERFPQVRIGCDLHSVFY